MNFKNKFKLHYLYFFFFYFFFRFFISLSIADTNIIFKKNINYFLKNFFNSDISFLKKKFYSDSSIKTPMNFKIIIVDKAIFFYTNLINVNIIVNYSISLGFNIVNFIFFSKIVLFLKQKQFKILYISKTKLDKPQSMFKKRNQLKIWSNYQYFNKKNIILKKKKISYIFYNYSSSVELFWYKIFLKKIRKIIKKKKAKGFVSIVVNQSFSIKSKNSRMGKGKGKHSRFISLQKIFKPLFVFKKVSFCRLIKLNKFFNKKSKNNFLLFYVKIKFYLYLWL